MIFLVAPDLARLLHLRAAEGGQERDERGEAAHHAVAASAGLPTTTLWVHGSRLRARPVTRVCESALA